MPEACATEETGAFLRTTLRYRMRRPGVNIVTVTRNRSQEQERKGHGPFML